MSNIAAVVDKCHSPSMLKKHQDNNEVKDGQRWHHPLHSRGQIS